MTWLQRHRLQGFIESSVWLVPVASVVAAAALHRVVWWTELHTRWGWLQYSTEGARAAVGMIASSMLTFMVFTFSILLLAVQIAGAQLSPRVIALAMKDRLLKRSLGVFVFTFTYSMAVLSRIGNEVPQLSMVVVVLGCFASIGLFLYLVDQTAKNLRPTGVLSRIAATANEVIENIYPRLLRESEALPAEQAVFTSDQPSHTVSYQGASGMLQAVDTAGLANMARRTRCMIRMAPQVGDFVTKGEALFYVFGGTESLGDDELHQAIAIGPERTPRQDPTFPFRIIVDIASKALSPAINDPSTAVLALDQVHRLLRVVGRRYLGDGTTRDVDGVVRVILPTPNWEDFVSLGMHEIRMFGASNLQVVRRLRAMIENLLGALPKVRHAALVEQLKLLDRAVERSFADPADRAYAGMSDYQGVGSSRGNQAAKKPVQDQ